MPLSLDDVIATKNGGFINTILESCVCFDLAATICKKTNGVAGHIHLFFPAMSDSSITTKQETKMLLVMASSLVVPEVSYN